MGQLIPAIGAGGSVLMGDQGKPQPAMLGDLLDDYSRQRVPAEEGRGYLKLTLVFLGICIAIPSFLLGSALVGGLGLRQAVAAIVLGTFVAAPICVAAAHVGARVRISTAMLLKRTFGDAGARLISAIVAIDMFCWFAVNTEIFGRSIQYTLQTIAHVSVERWVLCVAAGVLLTAVTIFGYRSVEKVAAISVPLLVVVLFAYMAQALIHTPFAPVWASGPLGRPISFATGTSIVAGTFLSVCVLLPDFTRYARSAKHSAISILIGLCIGGFPPFVFMGAYLTAATGEPDFVRVMLSHGWGLAAIGVIALTCWGHMNATLYSAGLNLAVMVQNVAKWKLTALAGIAGTCIALFGIVGRYVPFLVVLSVVLPPIAGVYTADYFARRSSYAEGESSSSRVSVGALIAWAAGIAVGFLTGPRGETGFGLFELTRVPAIDSFIVSFAAQFLIAKGAVLLTPRNSEALPESE